MINVQHQNQVKTGDRVAMLNSSEKKIHIARAKAAMNFFEVSFTVGSHTTGTPYVRFEGSRERGLLGASKFAVLQSNEPSSEMIEILQLVKRDVYFLSDLLSGQDIRSKNGSVVEIYDTDVLVGHMRATNHEESLGYAVEISYKDIVNVFAVGKYQEVLDIAAEKITTL